VHNRTVPLLALVLLLLGAAASCAGDADGTETSDRGAAVTEPSDEAAGDDAPEVLADDIPVAFTPAGGYGDDPADAATTA